MNHIQLRDYFAAQVIIGILSNGAIHIEDDIVEKAYRIADNMLVYRGQIK